MKKLFQNFWAMLCFVLIAYMVFDGLYEWRDARYVLEQQKSRNLATALAQVNGMVVDENLVAQINGILSYNGFENLQRMPSKPKDVNSTAPPISE